MENDVEFAAMPGLHKAIRLLSEVFESALIYPRTKDVAWIKTMGATQEFFSAGHAKHYYLCLATREAQRIESIISLPLEREYVYFEMKFYRKGEKNVFFSLWLYIELGTAKVAGGGYAGSPTKSTHVVHKR